jgi:hypothetical protein
MNDRRCAPSARVNAQVQQRRGLPNALRHSACETYVVQCTARADDAQQGTTVAERERPSERGRETARQREERDTARGREGGREREERETRIRKETAINDGGNTRDRERRHRQPPCAGGRRVMRGRYKIHELQQIQTRTPAARSMMRRCANDATFFQRTGACHPHTPPIDDVAFSPTYTLVRCRWPRACGTVPLRSKLIKHR